MNNNRQASITAIHGALAGLGSLALVAAAGAGFTGIAIDETAIGDVCVTDVYATFSENVDILLNIFDANVAIQGGFGSLVHNDLPGGSWAPQLSSNPSIDSFCLIGGEASFGNSTNADPNWGPAGFNQTPIPALAGWFNSNPLNFQGKAQDVTLLNALGRQTYAGWATHIMRLVYLTPPPGGKAISFTGSYTSYQGIGTPPEQGAFSFEAVLGCIPAPGALPLIGFAGLVGGRRRRA